MECQVGLGFQLIDLHNLILSVWCMEYCYSRENHFKMDQDDGDLFNRVRGERPGKSVGFNDFHSFRPTCASL